MVKKKVKINSIELYDNESQENTYCFPESGIVLKAKSLKEAYSKLDKLQKKRR